MFFLLTRRNHQIAAFAAPGEIATISILEDGNSV